MAGKGDYTLNETEWGGVTVPDAIVFMCLESLGILAMIGNSLLLYVIAACRYCERPSFVLISSLAVADILHGIVTTTFFYPPIVLKYNHFSEIAYRLMNVIDWTAWGITISHMSAICLDRLFAIVLLHRYPHDMTVYRARLFSIFAWSIFFTANLTLFALKVCCPVVPVHEFYTFDYYVHAEVMSGTHNVTYYDQLNISTGYSTGYLTVRNIYPYIYIPLELLTIVILAFSNPFTIFRLYGRYKRKRDIRRASTVLMRTIASLSEMKQQKIGRETFLNKDVKIFMQIITVTVIFFCYIFVYYLFFYIIKIDNKWLSMFNSFFYSTTHMINPVIYFTLNEEMQRQLRTMFPCLVKTQPTAAKPKSSCCVLEATPLLDDSSQTASKPNLTLVNANDEQQQQEQSVDTAVVVVVSNNVNNHNDHPTETVTAAISDPDHRPPTSRYVRFNNDDDDEPNSDFFPDCQLPRHRNGSEKSPRVTITDFGNVHSDTVRRCRTLDANYHKHSKQNNKQNKQKLCTLKQTASKSTYVVGSIIFDEKVTEL